MALSPTKITPVLDANCLDSGNAASEVFPPLATTTTTANDVGAGEQVLRNQTHTLNELKVNRAGDTMTDSLVITTSTANGRGLNATGNGSGCGVRGAGGLTGAGGVFIAGATGPANGLESTASGAGFGLVTGPGVASTGVAPTAGILLNGGGLRINATSPNKGVDPGTNDVLHGANITKAWGTVSLTGGAPYATQDDYNVTNVTEPIANIYQINFARPFANNTYAITFAVHAPGIGVSISAKTTTYCRFNVWLTTAPGTPDPNNTVDFHAVGRQ